MLYTVDFGDDLNKKVEKIQENKIYEDKDFQNWKKSKMDENLTGNIAAFVDDLSKKSCVCTSTN